MEMLSLHTGLREKSRVSKAAAAFRKLLGLSGAPPSPCRTRRWWRCTPSGSSEPAPELSVKINPTARIGWPHLFLHVADAAGSVALVLVHQVQRLPVADEEGVRVRNQEVGRLQK